MFAEHAKLQAKPPSNSNKPEGAPKLEENETRILNGAVKTVFPDDDGTRLINQTSINMVQGRIIRHLHLMTIKIYPT